MPEPVTVIAALFATPVPPLAGASVPATVTAPDVAVAGVKPVVPNVIVETPLAAGAVEAHVVPLEVNTLPDVLGATNKGADVPLPKITLFAVRVAKLVPPDVTGIAVVADRVVNAPAAGVVAPTVPLIGPPKPVDVSVVPFHVRLEEAPKAPELLN